jgi:hypothetical protein
MKFMGIPNRTKHPSYSCWLMMRARCNTPGATGYAHYGGRGIRVCERWASFEAFVEDMGPRPSPRHTVERRDGEGHYEPSNCFWATRLKQARNRPDYNRLDLDKARELRQRHAKGESMKSLSRQTGISYSAVRSAIIGDTWKENAE